MRTLVLKVRLGGNQGHVYRERRRAVKIFLLPGDTKCGKILRTLQMSDTDFLPSERGCSMTFCLWETSSSELK
jgi:hypothetical protein